MVFKSLIKKHSSSCDYLSVLVSESESEVVSVENSVTSLMKNNDLSYGVRVLFKGCWGLSYSNNLKEAEKVFKQALVNARLSSKYLKNDFRIEPPVNNSFNKIKTKINPLTVGLKSKLDKLFDFEKNAKADQRVKNVKGIILSSITKNRLLSESADLTQVFTNNSFKSMITALEGGVIQNTVKTHSKLGGYEVIDKLNLNKIAEEMVGKVIRLLHAKSPKPGKYPVICDNMMTGLFFHEAVGHACEADAVLTGTSVFVKKLGEKVGGEQITLIDDPTIEETGSYWFDDEGVKSRRTTLIQNGVLKNYLQSLTTASLMGHKPTGNGRVESPCFLPIPRMSNTTLKKGDYSFEELLKTIKKGFYVKGFKGGEVDPVTGDFSFGAEECYSIINGRVSEPLRDVTLGGNTLKILNGLLVGNDPKPSFIASHCGKEGQHVRVGDKCPHILVKEAIIGGRT